MRQKVLIFAIAAAGAALGANVQPILTGAGKLIFPEASPAAYLQASSGALTVAAGGTNQNVNLTPTGTGAVAISSAATIPLSVTSTAAGNMGIRINSSTGNNANYIWQNAGANVWYLLNNAGATNSLQLLNSDANGNATRLTVQQGGNTGIGTTPSYKLDVNGDINTAGVIRVGGTPGVSGTTTVCTSGACATTCTIIWSGGIRTGGTCP